MGIITESGLSRVRQDILQEAAFGRYRISGSTKQADLTQKHILSDGRVEFCFFLTGSEGSNIDLIELVGSDGTILAQAEEDITLGNAAEGNMYRFRIRVEKG